MTLTRAQYDFLCGSIAGFDSRTWRIEPIAETGSSRHFLRVVPPQQANPSYVLILWSVGDPDWDLFFEIEHLTQIHAPQLTPGIVACDSSLGCILQPDCGRTTLMDRVYACQNDTDALLQMYHSVLHSLQRFHALPCHTSARVQSRCMDTGHFLWESEYFATHLVREKCNAPQLLDAQWESLRRTLAREASGISHVCMHRDCQSQNILVNADDITFVDFQGARPGPAAYDIASLLYDPYVASYLNPVRSTLIDYAIHHFAQLSHETLHICALQRLMQALGAYANLSLNTQKTGYCRYIRPALQLLKTCSAQRGDMTRLRRICDTCLNSLPPGT